MISPIPTKRNDENRQRRLVWQWLVVLGLVVFVGGFSCRSQPSTSTGGETHFLKACSADGQACGDGLECLCGVCSLPCDDDAQCGNVAASCTAFSGSACGSSGAFGYCEAQCGSDLDCSLFSAGHTCVDGACRLTEPENGGIGKSTAGLTCGETPVSSNEILIVGDSFFAMTGQIRAFVEQHARAAGALLDGQSYRDSSRLIDNGLALPNHGILDQYLAASDESQVKLVVMNGGGADVLWGACEVADVGCPAIDAAAAAFESVLDAMAQRAVAQVVYVSYPDPVPEGVRVRMDALRPLLQKACAQSPVACAWLDLRPVFSGRYHEFVLEDGLNPSDAGAQASAAAVWSTVETLCASE